NLTGAGEPELLASARASAAFWTVSGTTPQLGRVFTEDDDRPGHDRVVVLSDSLWRRRFSADPAIVGKAITLNGEPYDVIGVLPPSFALCRLDALFPLPARPTPIDAWKPLALRQDEILPLSSFNYTALARLKPEVSLRQAEAEINTLQAGITANLPDRTE